MRRLLYIIIGVVVACSPQVKQEAPVLPAEDTLVVRTWPRDSAAIRERDALVAAELDYYLQRHNAQDEGYDMVARYAKEGDSVLAVYMPRNPMLLRNVGHWRGLPREGTGLTHDAIGRMFIGTFENDTLLEGIRIDTAGIYAGHLSRNGDAEGQGIYRAVDGSYYAGQCYGDLHEGFGFCVSPTYLHAGHWRKGQFRGERMHYTSDRVYGIDISRYQHERGRKRFTIDWRHVRITGLGHRISQQRVSGTVDYPVSFVYVKSTEGISIRNKYYQADCAAARKQGISVGAYHFFSTRQSASAQATFFLQNSQFRRGDLPPMLDVEPTDALIERMGGPEVLFSEMRVWLKRIEARIGVRPILYLNQRFVRMYLSQAPDLKHDYQIWIARYGEYKPDAHLIFWQLSADGRVRGIQGEVDINVFNGYQSQWDDFLREETVP